MPTEWTIIPVMLIVASAIVAYFLLRDRQRALRTPPTPIPHRITWEDVLSQHPGIASPLPNGMSMDMETLRIQCGITDPGLTPGLSMSEWADINAARTELRDHLQAEFDAILAQSPICPCAERWEDGTGNPPFALFPICPWAEEQEAQRRRSAPRGRRERVSGRKQPREPHQGRNTGRDQSTPAEEKSRPHRAIVEAQRAWNLRGGREDTLRHGFRAVCWHPRHRDEKIRRLDPHGIIAPWQGEFEDRAEVSTGRARAAFVFAALEAAQHNFVEHRGRHAAGVPIEPPAEQSLRERVDEIVAHRDGYRFESERITPERGTPLGGGWSIPAPVFEPRLTPIRIEHKQTNTEVGSAPIVMDGGTDPSERPRRFTLRESGGAWREVSTGIAYTIVDGPPGRLEPFAVDSVFHPQGAPTNLWRVAFRDSARIGGERYITVRADPEPEAQRYPDIAMAESDRMTFRYAEAAWLESGTMLVRSTARPLVVGEKIRVHEEAGPLRRITRINQRHRGVIVTTEPIDAAPARDIGSGA